MATPVAPTATERILDKGYDASASLGKVVGIWTAGSGLFFGFIMLIIAIVLIVKRNPRIVIDATIEKANCKKNVVKDDKNRERVVDDCVLDISFVAVDGKTYKSKISTQDKNYIDGGSIKVSYHEDNPNDVRQHVIRMRTVGWILLGVSILSIVGSGFSLYLTLNYKLYQSAQGVGFATGTAVNAYNFTTSNE